MDFFLDFGIRNDGKTKSVIVFLSTRVTYLPMKNVLGVQSDTLVVSRLSTKSNTIEAWIINLAEGKC